MILSKRMLITADAAKSLQSCPTLCDPIDGSPHPWDFPGKNTEIQEKHLLLYFDLFCSCYWCFLFFFIFFLTVAVVVY